MFFLDNSTAKTRHFCCIFILAFSLSGCHDKGSVVSNSESVNGINTFIQRPLAGYNVIVISFDALRADALGTYGYTRPVSPNIDAFAHQSLVFDNAYSAAQATPTSFAAVWTGKLPFRVFIGWKLTDKHTLASVFKKAGYKTGGFTDNQQLLVERGFAVGFDDYNLLTSANDDELLDTSLKWLENNAGKRIFAWFHFLSPHTPYDYREMSKQFYQQDYEGRFKMSASGHFETQSPEELSRVRDLYDGEVFYADSLFQKILNKINELEIDDRTIIVLTADHGEEFMEHGGLQHDSVYEEIIHIPLVIYTPEMNAGARTNIQYSNVDLFKTLPALVGINSEKMTDGINLFTDIPAQRPIIAAAMTSKIKRQYGLILQTNKYHLDCKPESAERLFDLSVDSSEHNDLALDFPDKLERMYDTLELVVGGNPCSIMQSAVAGKSVESDLTEQQLERLRSLGYIQ